MKKKRTKQSERRPKARGLVERAWTGDWRPAAPSITDSWTEGVLWDTDLVYPVAVAREQLKGWTEDAARAAWKWLEAVMRAWALEHGERPRREDAEPWRRAGLHVSDSIDLLQRLHKENYPKLESQRVRYRQALAVTVLREAALSEAVNNAANANFLATLFPRPANEHGRAALKGALLIALEGRSKEVALLHQLAGHLRQQVRQQVEVLEKGRNKANKQRRDLAAAKKTDQRADALAIWKANPAWRKKQVAEEIRDRYQSGRIKSGAGGVKLYSVAQIMKNCAGVKKEALVSLSKPLLSSSVPSSDPGQAS